MKNPQWSFTHEDALECGIIIIIIICRNFNHFFKLWRIGPSMWPSYASKTTLQNWLKFLTWLRFCQFARVISLLLVSLFTLPQSPVAACC